ncbi:hypothetical protein QTG54_009675 [Skeletonema marinoi]|uniref:Phospholipase B-like n=1 Tax=Skeletonema marinoi TaxID=267567 RepID=A0AAD9DA78_9STRA|nr:hypothetical protein QTG54_009675 [Skeletonema marinoi]
MMISRHLLQSCLVAIMIAMVHAGSKTAKQGKGSSGEGRWSGNNHRPSRWSSPDQWSSPDSSSPDSWSKDYDDEYFDDDDRSGSRRLPKCSLANPVEEQYQLIIRSWKLAYLASNANAGTISTYEETVTWHANLVMEAFMTAVEGYEYDDFDKDDIVAWGESFGDGHPTSVKFTNDRQQEAVCSLTKALVLMMKDSCLYSRWKRTLEISAFYFMEGFIEGNDIDMNLSKCIDTPKEPKDRKRDDGDDDKYDRKKRKNPRQL